MDPVAWPGIFRPLRHHVPDPTYRFFFRGQWVYFASCQAPCWSASNSATELPWCARCWSIERAAGGAPDSPTTTSGFGAEPPFRGVTCDHRAGGRLADLVATQASYASL
jgi:hypothetical protein